MYIQGGALAITGFDFSRQIRRGDHRSPCDYKRALDHVAQLSHVSRPTLAFEQLQTFGFYPHDLFARGRCELSQKMLDQGRQILGAFAQCR